MKEFIGKEVIVSFNNGYIKGKLEFDVKYSVLNGEPGFSKTQFGVWFNSAKLVRYIDGIPVLKILDVLLV